MHQLLLAKTLIYFNTLCFYISIISNLHRFDNNHYSFRLNNVFSYSNEYSHQFSMFNESNYINTIKELISHVAFQNNEKRKVENYSFDRSNKVYGIVICVSRHWRYLQHCYFLDTTTKDVNAVDKWTGMLIKSILELNRLLWKERCNFFHRENEFTYEQRQRDEV